ncbi:DUF2314 domain-containing protein [Microbulbifer sp. OS29]|uniref:DUF2314 domain-containing protein n=1 Tax=Microbulbifer okhotskensis TaxID=2926617 RepID=A0A9X2EP67_9GAMM|nr:DUF2314 domain-containing protein [Microbulbifer okhotskensis]MCO1335869.1 DUF2314 domain-containing protein [Microbulbifer okhotskensis]
MNSAHPETSEEPVFIAHNSNDPAIRAAHSMAANSITNFIELVKSRDESDFLAKLRFHDPNLSEDSGEDQFLYLWLMDVYYHTEEKILSGVFFEVPESLKEWHKVGDRLGFEADDVFDWMVNTHGHVQGAYTIRATREKLSTNKEKSDYDSYIGVSSYAPIVK